MTALFSLIKKKVGDPIEDAILRNPKLTKEKAIKMARNFDFPLKIKDTK